MNMQQPQSVPGDLITNLQVDPSSMKPPQADVVYNLLDNFKDSSAPETNTGDLLKYSGIITIVMTLLILQPVQSTIDGIFKNQYMKIGAQALLIFLITFIALQNLSKK